MKSRFYVLGTASLIVLLMWPNLPNLPNHPNQSDQRNLHNQPNHPNHSSSSALINANSAIDTETNPIVIGATMSHTGAYSTQGIPANNGYLLCEEDVNRAGGIFGRDLKFLIYDDESSTSTAVRLYEQLILHDNVDLIMGPYGSTLTEAVAPVNERYKQVMISPLAATTSIWEQGRQYLFMVLPPAELFLAGLIDMADANGFTNVAIIQENALFPKAAGSGAIQMARERGMDVVLETTYASGTTDFSIILDMIEYREAEVVGMAASSLNNFITFVEQMHQRGLEIKMFGTSGAVTEFAEALGPLAENTFGLSAWEPGLPNPGIDAFTESYRSNYGMEPSFHAAGAYASCQIFVEAIKRAGSLESDAIRDELRSLEMQTVLGSYAVDERGYQIANKGVFIQWRDGKKVVVWPDDVAASEPIIPD